MSKFGGFPGGMGNVQNLMKQAQKMQKDLEKKQEEAANTEFDVSVGGGAVTVKATGAKEIKEIVIKKEVVDPNDVEMLQDLILTCINEALRKVDNAQSMAMGKYNIPGMM